MRTPLSKDNPFDFNRQGYAWEKVPVESDAHLDYGCYEGEFLQTLSRRRVRRLVGVDVNEDAIVRARERFPSLELVYRSSGMPLPFDCGTFSSVSIMDVIEHIADQKQILNEVNRVLRPDGVLIITTPGWHLFSFLDAGNLKFRFPRFHKWWFLRSHSLKDYEYRYVSNPFGLIGDVESVKGWHEHFSKRSMRSLLDRSGFEPIEFDGAGLFHRPLVWLDRIIGRVRWMHRIINKLILLDHRLFHWTHLFCFAHKKQDAILADSE